MSKLNIDQQTIFRLFTDEKSDFLIPDYQRPYAWEDTECQTLWDDLFTFAFPNNDCDAFKNDDEYFLGPIVTFKNSDNKLEVIDGQQRLTTLMLLLRAFYDKFLKAQDKNTVNIKNSIAKCIWKSDEFDNLIMDELKIDSQVSTDDDKDEFLSILRTGVIEKSYKSRYANNFRFFQKQIDEFIEQYPTWCAHLPARIMKNCILLPIEAENQDTALRIFSTLNDRGKPLSDADIFKAQFYKYYSDKNEKDKFIERWKSLEEISEKIFTPQSGTPMDELFTKYMYFERAKQGIQSTTTEALRKFFERDSYKLLKNDEALDNLEALAQFWLAVENQDDQFSERVLRDLFVLNYAPNGMWTYLLSVYFMANRNSDNQLDEAELHDFLNKMISFIWGYAFMHPGVNALRTPVYPEMVSLVNGGKVDFNKYRFDRNVMMTTLENYYFGNQRPITKSMLTWWALKNNNQQIFKLDEKLEIEHIYAKKRQENDKGLSDSKNMEALGNKALLEKNINIRASEYRFSDKKKYYEGFTTDKGKIKNGTKNAELLTLAKTKEDFTEQDIIERSKSIFIGFIKYLEENDLLL